ADDRPGRGRADRPDDRRLPGRDHRRVRDRRWSRHGETAGGSPSDRGEPCRPGPAGGRVRSADPGPRESNATADRSRCYLTRLPFEVLPTDDGRRLIDDYQIGYLTCGRDVLRFGSEATGQPGEPLVVADPDFDLEARIPTRPVPARPGFWSRL